MQILALVDESDIGKIADGQTVTFTVAAYAGRSFNGKVRQKRLLSATVENVVNYTVVVVVDNSDGKLLPGMTATVKFLTSSAQNVLAIANAALRFTPTAAMLGADSALLTARRDSAARNAPPAAAPAAGRAGGDPFGPPGAGGPPRPRRAVSDSSGTLWTVDAKGKFTPHRVRTGLTDGQKTQITGKDIDVGMQVIVGIATGTSGAAGAPAANPFQQPQQGGGRRPGGF
jgi:HlyD family secretion protein